MRTIILPLVLLAGMPAVSSAQWTVIETGASAEFRGLDAAGPLAVWATGRSGVFARSLDGGKSWRTDSIRGAANLFLVDVHAISATTAYVLGTSFDGGLARIYKTADGGRSWVQQYEDARAGAFYDGLAFWDDSTGVAFGDPVAGGFTVAVTRDGGATWRRLPGSNLPEPLPSESAFAASGRAIAVQAGGFAWFGTGGGAHARVFRSGDFGVTWTAAETALPGAASAGIFSLDFRSPSEGLAVGGDFRQAAARGANVLRTADGGLTWTLTGATVPPGVKYGFAHAPGTDTWVAVAPAGAAQSHDGGRTWSDLRLSGFNTVHFETAQAGWLAGTDGRIAVYR
jgi:photosystem II stability/assembly factor-like uncharacterized protein